MAYKDVTPPAGGKISIQNGKLTVPENPIIPFIRGDGTGPDIWAASVRVFDAAVQKAYGGKTQDVLVRGLRRRERSRQVRQLAAGRHGRGVQGISRRHQRPAHHAGRRRHPLAQRRAAPDARPLRLPAPGAIFHGRALAREASGEGGHGHLPRKHRGHLRGHRIRRRARRSAQKVLGFHREGISRRISRKSASARSKPPEFWSAVGIKFPRRAGRHRHQAVSYSGIVR